MGYYASCHAWQGQFDSTAGKTIKQKGKTVFISAARLTIFLGFCGDAFIFLCFSSREIREAEKESGKERYRRRVQQHHFWHQLWSWGLVTARALCLWCSSQPSFSLTLPFHLFLFNYNLIQLGQTSQFIYLFIYQSIFLIFLFVYLLFLFLLTL